MLQLVIRFLIGGAAVSFFALLADLLRPKGFAGLFGAAPSVALATLMLAGISEGPAYAATEARSMVLGDIAFVAYAACCVYFLAIRRKRAAPTCALALIVWGAAVSALYLGVLK